MNSYIFKIILITSIIINVVYSLNILFNSLNIDYIQSFYYVLSNSFYIIILMMLLAINTINTINIFDQNLFYILRFESKKEYYKEILKNVFLSNLVFIIMNIAILIIMSNIIFGSTFSISNWQEYNITNIVYIIFYIIRAFIVMEIIMGLLFIIKKVLGKISILIYSILIFIPLILNNYNVIKDLSNIPLYPMNYIVGFTCTSFNLEVCSSIIYISILLLISIIAFNILVANSKGVIDEK